MGRLPLSDQQRLIVTALSAEELSSPEIHARLAAVGETISLRGVDQTMQVLYSRGVTRYTRAHKGSHLKTGRWRLTDYGRSFLRESTGS